MSQYVFISSIGDPVLFLGLLGFYILLISLPFSFWALGGKKSSNGVRFLVALANLVLTAQLVFR